MTDMRKTILLLAALLPAALWAQSTNSDTATRIIDRYVKMLNYEGLPDSTLVMETTITYHNQPDTFIMRRWFLPPDMLRVEVWSGDSLTNGYCTNGTDRFRVYFAKRGWWDEVAPADFERRVSYYEFRTILSKRDTTETTYTYAGTTTLKGETLEVVRVDRPNVYSRYLLFEQRSGLLLFIIETDEMPVESLSPGYNHAAWKAYHEYQPMGASLIVSQESFMRNGMLAIMNTKMHFEPRNTMLFNQD